MHTKIQVSFKNINIINIYLILILTIHTNSSFLKQISKQKLNTLNYFENSTIYKTQNSLQLILYTHSVQLLNVPDVRQATLYTCGPSALVAVFNYYGFTVRQSTVAYISKANPQDGTLPQNMLFAIKKLGFNGELRQYMQISDLQTYILNKIAVIVDIQAWRDDPEQPYEDDWEDGHYAIVIGFDNQYLYFEDPSLLGQIGYIKKSEFMQRWHDQQKDGKRYKNFGIIIYGKSIDKSVIIELQ